MGERENIEIVERENIKLRERGRDGCIESGEREYE